MTKQTYRGMKVITARNTFTGGVSPHETLVTQYMRGSVCTRSVYESNGLNDPNTDSYSYNLLAINKRVRHPLKRILFEKGDWVSNGHGNIVKNKWATSRLEFKVYVVRLYRLS